MKPVLSRLLWVIFSIDIAFIILHAVFGWSIINLDEEGNLAAWYSSTKLLGLCVICLATWYKERNVRPSWLNLRLTWVWIVIALVFLLLSIDETSSVHERIARVVMQDSTVGLDIRETVLGGDRMKDSFAWVILFSPLIIAVILLFALFFYRRLSRFPGCYIPAMAALLMFIAAVAFESTIYFLPSLSEWASEELFKYRLFVVVEESGEILGSTLFLLAFFNYWVRIEDRSE